MIATVIIDDDKASVGLVKKILLDNFKKLYIVGEAHSVKNGVKTIKDAKPELVFLDIEMPDGDAFDVLNHFEKPDFSVIFITSYDQYALRAIKMSALDYILKPVNKAEIIKAVNKYLELKNPKGKDDRYEVLKHSINREEPAKPVIVLPASKEFKVVSPDEIIRCQADSYYSKVFLRDGSSLMVTKSLKDFETLLDEFAFIRIHNSHLVNMTYVSNFDMSKESHVVMKDGLSLPVSRRRKEKLKNFFKTPRI